MKTIKASSEHVFCKPIEIDEVRESGLVIPKTGNKPPHIFCEVISVGPDVGEIAKVGDVIVCHSNGGQIILLDQVTYKILKKTEVYGTLEIKNEENK